MQRRFVTGRVYLVEGVSERQRRLKFVGRMKLKDGRRRYEHLIFRPVRKASKFRSSRKK